MLSHKLKLIHVERNTTPQHLFSTIPESTQYEIRFRVLYVFYAYYYVSSSGAGSKQEKRRRRRRRVSGVRQDIRRGLF